MQKWKPPAAIHLDTRVQLPKFSDQINGEVVDSSIRNISKYFREHPALSEDQNFKIASLQLEGLAKKWWDTVIGNNSIAIHLYDPQDLGSTIINTWTQFFQGLREQFYPPGYLQPLMARWLQLWKLSGQTVDAFIKIYCKLRLQLQISDPEPMLVIKFNSSIIFPIKREIDLFQSASLD